MQLDLIVITYGFQERRVEIIMKPTVPPAYVGKFNELTMWTQILVFYFGRDVKHTERWDCYVCGVSCKASE